MRYVSIDIETTGLDPKRHQIIEFAAVIEDTEKDVPVEELPYFRIGIYHEHALWETEALAFHLFHLKDIMNIPDGLEPYMLPEYFNNFLKDNGYDKYNHGPLKITAAGKNFASFDRRFLEEIPNWNEAIKIRDRILDPGILFMKKNDDVPPTMKQCLRRAGLEHEVAHRALRDARDVITLIRRGMNGRK